MDKRALKLRDLVVLTEECAPLAEVPALDVAAGEALGISGPSGAGKSSLLFALAGLAPRMRGSVLWGDTDLSALGTPARAAFRARHIGLIFQDHLLFEELGALANATVVAGFRSRSERRALQDEAARRLSSLSLPDDARDVSRFSGGERQRVAVARALAHRPSILLADEPTASLDSANAEHLTQLLLAEAHQAGRTLIVVSHDPQLLARMDRVITMSHGVLVNDFKGGSQ
ncbi:ABC transporter ATP-binding protein [Pseudooceanicola sediminis]|uniref:ABC transporter ATP-binding protein n=1 Tax=Pseudooceanicola sediminis TaxID=2211117 RepID=A0A399IZW8_9RHOB|nr:ABC transporter ATP-binding protein [Pseudooceanicola sediminis]KAA2313886.1 ABC transporter ATP-binding protein [Puniceibacterium sp. HSS470]RII38703.1 ABC transporter ATP-binding protein [Pseudooceanicola sediminis]|tara:strand:- start:4839 stop:5528 length:690 start_codon:yes stop_codon:yes gene_type:complete